MEEKEAKEDQDVRDASQVYWVLDNRIGLG
jgi:hypothetical protein